ncbi:hypothetical protein [Gloeothece verrucosa]|uniref:Cytochrome c family protein n=1 Tax=Gloeothece verrucosa (strain PCC 7822) TaxID=497965 RepID=E0ULZ7_GLOV7|nr:hypothetical protein [Gloeothece verrucosa]ADN17977.1 hypothetical protein Cyan7822_6149 [Gloeothece verrucosa PCC 7822]
MNKIKRLILGLIAICIVIVVGLGINLKVVANPKPPELNSNLSTPELNSTLPTIVNGCSTSDMACLIPFAWQTFLALNWPTDGQGKPLEHLWDNPDAPRQWEFYQRPEEVFSPAQQPLNSPLKLDGEILLLLSKGQRLSENEPGLADSFLEPIGYPLIDQTHNYIIYDIRLNKSEANQIITNHWYNIQCLEKIQDSLKFAADNTSGYPLEIKTAWRILSYINNSTDSGQEIDESTYYTVKRTVIIPKDKVYNPKSVLSENTPVDTPVKLKLGLIGFHIAYKVPIDGLRNKKPQWVWATFEHISNSPSVPDNINLTQDQKYTLYDPLIGCLPGNCNTPIKTPYYFNVKQSPSAVDQDGKPQRPTQVVREENLSMTNFLDDKFQLATLFPELPELKETVWKNYQMRGAISVQWQYQPIPNYLANSAIETYVHEEDQSCLACHSNAKVTIEKNIDIHTDFSYLFKYNAQRWSNYHCPDS